MKNELYTAEHKNKFQATFLKLHQRSHRLVVVAVVATVLPNLRVVAVVVAVVLAVYRMRLLITMLLERAPGRAAHQRCAWRPRPGE